MARCLPTPPTSAPDLADAFRGGPNPAFWLTSYLEHWTTPDRARARFSAREDGTALLIEPDQPDWRVEDSPLRVSNLQTGSYSGPAGSDRGTHRHRPDGLIVRTTVPTRLLWAPSAGRVDVTVSASRDPGCMLAAWLVGSEHLSPNDAGEICIFEIDAPEAGAGWSARSGIKAHHDSRLRTTMIEAPLWFDAGRPHTWTVIWGGGHTIIGCNGRTVTEIPQAPDYPLFLMLGLFEIGEPNGSYPKTARLHSVNGWSESVP